MEEFEPPVIAYDLWVAAHLFINTGVAAAEVLERLEITGEQWKTTDRQFRYLQGAGSWYWGIEGRPDAATDPAFLRYILGGREGTGVGGEFHLGLALAEIRAAIRRDPHIGPFQSVRWRATFLAEHYQTNGAIYSHDDHVVFFDGRPLWDRQSQPLAGLDARSFRVLSDRWMRDNDRVYAQGQRGSDRAFFYFYVVKDADPETFTALNLRYARDKDAAYYITEKRIRTRSVGEFSIVPYSVGTIHGTENVIDHGSVYAKDAEHAYCAGVKLAGADPGQFKQVSSGGYQNGEYFSDGRHVWYQGRPVEHADAATFLPTDVGQYTATDRHRPYWMGFSLPVSVTYDREGWAEFFSRRPELRDYWWHQEDRRRKDPASAERTPLGGNFFTDGERVYVADIWLEQIDLKQFRHLGECFFACGDTLYCYAVHHPGFLNGGPMKNGDPATFEALGRGWYADRNNAYKITWRGDARAVKIDRPTFKVISDDRAEDKDGVIESGIRRKRRKPRS